MRADFWAEKSVLVTGGTGSWGWECVRQLLSVPVRKVIVYSRDEYKQSLLAYRVADHRLRCLLGDVRDSARLALALRGVDVVIHLAALKQVGAGEYGPMEFVKTNIVGTMRVVEMCLQQHVPRALLVSSDKAVFPTTLYGGTKMIAERLWLGGNVYSPAPSQPWFSVVRSGNALGSRGSVLEVWREQKARGEPLTICDPAHTRFVITLPAVVRVCLQTIEEMFGGELTVPAMRAVTIGDLATAFAPGWPTVEVGSRGAGEKQHEHLTADLSSDQAERISAGEMRRILQQEDLL